LINGKIVAWRGVVVVLAGLLVFNLLNNWLLPAATPVTRPIEVLLLVALARAYDLTWPELGLARTTWARGLRWAAVAVGIVAAGFAVAFALPMTRTAFLDRRGEMAIGTAFFEAAVPVFVGTVLLEELAFRGVLWAMVNRVRGPVYATLVSSVAFGLWHVLPSLDIRGTNSAIGDLAGGGAAAGVAVAVLSVAATTLAGMLLCELRRRSGSLLAPIGLHWATNGLGYVFAALAWAGAE
jgi:CAAX protease family protein